LRNAHACLANSSRTAMTPEGLTRGAPRSPRARLHLIAATFALLTWGGGTAPPVRARTPAEPVRPLDELIRSTETIVVGTIVRAVYVGNMPNSDEYGKVFDQPGYGRREDVFIKVSKTLKSPIGPFDAKAIRATGLILSVDRDALRRNEHVYFFWRTFKADGQDVYVVPAPTMPKSNVADVVKAVRSQSKQ